jgi:hypothetical protein
MYKSFFLLLVACGALVAQEPRTQLLWPEGAPGAVGTQDADKPSLTIYLPPPGKSNGTAVVVCPGGGYSNLAVLHEGRQVGYWFNSFGVTASCSNTASRRAIIIRSSQRRPTRLGWVRSHPRIWHAPDASASGLHPRRTSHPPPRHALRQAHPPRPTHRSASCRPDFLFSATRDQLHHRVHPRGSARNLLATTRTRNSLKASRAKTGARRYPPTFLFHTSSDTGVPPQTRFSSICVARKRRAAEMHLLRTRRTAWPGAL